MGKVKEIWEPVKGFPDYSVSNLGRVISRRTSKEKFIGSVLPDGYIRVALSSETAKRQVDVHKLVAETFIPNPKNLPEVNHIDEDKSNNQVNNLEWCTKSYNINYGSRNYLVSEKLTNGIMSRTVEALDPTSGNIIYRFPSAMEAQRSGFDQGAISNCCRGVRKTHKGFLWRYV